MKSKLRNLDQKVKKILKAKTIQLIGIFGLIFVLLNCFCKSEWAIIIGECKEILGLVKISILGNVNSTGECNYSNNYSWVQLLKFSAM